MPQLIGINHKSGAVGKRSWPYQAKVIKTFEQHKSRIGAMKFQVIRLLVQMVENRLSNTRRRVADTDNNRRNRTAGFAYRKFVSPPLGRNGFYDIPLQIPAP